MILFDYDKAVHLMGRSGIDLLLPHTLLNGGYLADHWYHLVNTTVGPYTTFDVDESYQLLVGLPRDRKVEPFITCRRGAEEGEMYVWDVWIKDKRIWGPLPTSKKGILTGKCSCRNCAIRPFLRRFRSQHPFPLHLFSTAIKQSSAAL